MSMHRYNRKNPTAYTPPLHHSDPGASERIAADLERYKAAGGHIERIPIGVSGLERGAMMGGVLASLRRGAARARAKRWPKP